MCTLEKYVFVGNICNLYRDAVFPIKFCDGLFLKCLVMWFSRLATSQSDIEKRHVSDRLLTGPSSPFYEWRSLSEWCQYLSVLMTRSVSADKNSPDYPVTTPLKFTTRLSVVRLSTCLLNFYSSLNLIISCRYVVCVQGLVCANIALAIPGLALHGKPYVSSYFLILAVTAVRSLERL